MKKSFIRCLAPVYSFIVTLETGYRIVCIALGAGRKQAWGSLSLKSAELPLAAREAA